MRFWLLDRFFLYVAALSCLRASGGGSRRRWEATRVVVGIALSEQPQAKLVDGAVRRENSVELTYGLLNTVEAPTLSQLLTCAFDVSLGVHLAIGCR